MNWSLLLVLVLLGAATVMFAMHRPRMDVVAVLMLALLPLTGVLSVADTLAGFADPNVVLIAALFVIGEALSRTGITYRLGDRIAGFAGTSTARLIVLLMVAVAALGAVMSSTGVVAIFIPVVLSICRRMGVSPRQLMMPLSMAALISGMLSLIATAPNLVVDAELARAGHGGFGFFTITPFGLIVLVLGIGYMLFARRWLAGPGAAEGTSPPGAPGSRGFAELIADYRLDDRDRRLRIARGSPLAGARLAEAALGSGVIVLAVERRGLLGRGGRIVPAEPGLALRRGDVLLVHLAHTLPGEDETWGRVGLERLPLAGSLLDERSRETGLAELMLAPASPLLGRTVAELGLDADAGVEVIGLRRGGRAVPGPLARERVGLGDTVLVLGPWPRVRRLGARGGSFVALELPGEAEQSAPAAHRAPAALTVLALMVAAMASGVVPNVVAALAACLLLGLLGCIDMASAYRSIHWPTLLVIVGMLPFATALKQTGGIELAVRGLLGAFGSAAPPVVLAVLFAATALIGLFISNTATAVLMAPVAIGLAEQLGASPAPFAMTVALAASTAFASPVASPVNTLVLGPGGYRFADFARVGAPFTLVVLLVAVLAVPWLLPFGG
ncbi:SLC13 family permease [Leucobacter massiliensis]|uniref:SLC13 family permease n=1 Tax=Leucobacter massiliensis TaxID=1686285 RepID=A0A2S9QNK8_9MICO|nr:SLC13 family permease [Leucobacter massiliensis]PRI11175.1 SLC13 family permease [Leucobacter massiliensis]